MPVLRGSAIRISSLKYADVDVARGRLSCIIIIIINAIYRAPYDDVGSQYVNRYGGDMPCRHLYTITAVLKIIRWRDVNVM